MVWWKMVSFNDRKQCQDAQNNDEDLALQLEKTSWCTTFSKTRSMSRIRNTTEGNHHLLNRKQKSVATKLATIFGIKTNLE